MTGMHIHKRPSWKPDEWGPSQLSRLTPARRRIALSLLRDYNIDETARDTYLSAYTVKTHLCRIRRDLRARDRTHLVAALYETGFAFPSWAHQKVNVTYMRAVFDAPFNLIDTPFDPGQVNLLHDREIRTIKLVTQGLTNHAIAKLEYIEEDSVKSRLKEIRNKLNLKNRHYFSVFAYESGLEHVELTLTRSSNRPAPAGRGTLPISK
ncbi:helix-turn-helix transcriptional regulator [Saccharopolyspora sp. ASAGF58]|uniref:LuxR C-terminal-related transcriptional regulator n=1 Tax=Saccharopolyspora sp. ASAGF58 TaxID=2719023 RepID=UPI0014402657|nr:helix-turn-helix transcriptional regulator [Saccharopolyspora sp. ASAGF58]QIZ37949.1 helix-turn-helix transcriptional regulator [Saccharopolyspora sp. ASAGF58]